MAKKIVHQGDFGLFLPHIFALSSRLEAVFPASRHTSALVGQRFNQNQSPHTHQVVCGDGQPVGPVHPIQTMQLYLTQLAV
jgi:hypothetical protein